MTEEQFCKNDSTFDGEQVDSIKQIAFRSFNGEELKEYVEHHISLVKESDSLPCVSSRAIEFEAAIGLLRDLADVQNGAPLETYREEWEGIMEATHKFLNEHES